jgi:aspartate-semialdehyde dehydrogenase
MFPLLRTRSIKLADPVALVGSDSLLGREIRDIIATAELGISLHLIGANETEAGKLTRVGDEPAVVNELTEESLADARVIVLAAGPEASRKALEFAGDPPDAAIVDLTFIAEERPDARLRAPMVESGADEAVEAAVHVIAHPAAIAMALFLRRLQIDHPIQRSIIHVLVPASEHGTPGVEELQQQTVNLLSFKSMPKAIFDAQLSFNLLASYGEEAPAALEVTELRIERHLATLLDLPGEGEGAPMPSLRVVQAPVFHGYSFSAWVEFEEAPDVESLEGSLAIQTIDVRGGDLEPPNNVGQAGIGGISVGGILPDRNAADACWFWLTADNLRLAAENAVAVVQQLV